MASSPTDARAASGGRAASASWLLRLLIPKTAAAAAAAATSQPPHVGNAVVGADRSAGAQRWAIIEAVARARKVTLGLASLTVCLTPTRMARSSTIRSRQVAHASV